MYAEILNIIVMVIHDNMTMVSRSCIIVLEDEAKMAPKPYPTCLCTPLMIFKLNFATHTMVPQTITDPPLFLSLETMFYSSKRVFRFLHTHENHDGHDEYPHAETSLQTKPLLDMQGHVSTGNLQARQPSKE